MIPALGRRETGRSDIQGDLLTTASLKPVWPEQFVSDKQTIGIKVSVMWESLAPLPWFTGSETIERDA